MLGLEKLLDEMTMAPIQLYNTLIHNEPDKQMLLFYSLAYLADNYIEQAENGLKRGSDYEATYYSAKAAEVRQVSIDVFGYAAEKEYYKGYPYKVPKGVRTKMPPEQLQQLAQFCMANVSPDPEVLQDNKMLIMTIKQLFKHEMKLLGVERKYVQTLINRAKVLIDKPPKLGGVYEMMLLLIVVKDIEKTLKDQPEKDEEREARRERIKKRRERRK